MNMKLFGCICLVAGTSIGAGILALPIILAKFGLIYGSVLMLSTWGICYLSALLNLELNLRAGRGLPLGALGMHFSGAKANVIGSSSLLLLCYALVCAYIYGGTSTLMSVEGLPLTFTQTACAFTVCIGLVVLWPVAKIDQVNRVLFISLIVAVLTILLILLGYLDFTNLPMSFSEKLPLFNYNSAIPVVLTAFGFQVIFHTLVNYTEKDSVMLKRAFFWGSLFPAIVYIIWTTVVCSLIYHHNPQLFAKMVLQGIEVGEMVQELSSISHLPIISSLIWLISFLAVAKSMICVSLGLIDALKIKYKVLANHTTAVLCVLIPALGVAILVPNAFIKALAFAGAILAFMAILLPLYLLGCANAREQQTCYYPIVRRPIILVLLAFYGFWVVISELCRIFCF